MADRNLNGFAFYLKDFSYPAPVEQVSPQLASSSFRAEHHSSHEIQNNGNPWKESPKDKTPKKNTELAKRKITTPTLDEFSRDLTGLSRSGELDPVIGRDAETERVLQILLRRTKNNPVLIGEPGVGKTAVVEGLAHFINSKDCPADLKGKRVMALDVGAIVAGTKYRGEFEERIKKILKEVKAVNEDKNSAGVILFIDELHTLVGAGAAQGSLDAANILKEGLARGEYQVLGATTNDEYRKYIEKDAALERRFQSVKVHAPSDVDTLAILRGLRQKHEDHHGVEYTDEALEAAVTLSSRYLPDRNQPDKAIDLLDEAGARVQIQHSLLTPEMLELKQLINKKVRDQKDAIKSEQHNIADDLADKIYELDEEFEALAKVRDAERNGVHPLVTAEVIRELISAQTGIPVNSLSQSEGEKLMHLEESLHTKVIGQNEAINSVARAIRRGRAGFKDSKRPIGSFLFLGPTGTGKTLTAKTVADIIFEKPEAFIRIDMSEFMESLNISRLIGAPPGYVGHEEGGDLTEQVRRNPYSVVLFDEIEKAHPDVLNLMLQILEDGRITDSKGRVVNFKDTIIIMTSNLGVKVVKEDKIGFNKEVDQDLEKIYETTKANCLKEAHKSLRPEFINRLDEIVVFHHLGMNEMSDLIHTELKGLHDRLGALGMTLSIDEDCEELLKKEGYNIENGARPLRRAIQRLLEDPLSEEILSGTFKGGDKISGIRDGDTIKFYEVTMVPTQELAASAS